MIRVNAPNNNEVLLEIPNTGAASSGEYRFEKDGETIRNPWVSDPAGGKVVFKINLNLGGDYIVISLQPTAGSQVGPCTDLRYVDP